RHLHEWQVIIETLQAEGYRVSEAPAVFSPHLLPLEQGGRPHVRERVFITATYDPDGVAEGLPTPPPVHNRSPRGGDGCDLSADERSWIDAWDEWVQIMWGIRTLEAKTSGEPVRRLPGFPIWSDAWVETSKLRIPEGTPVWKENFLVKNAALYTEYKSL